MHPVVALRIPASTPGHGAAFELAVKHHLYRGQNTIMTISDDPKTRAENSAQISAPETLGS